MRQVLEMIAQDKPLKVVAAELGVSVKTAEYFWGKIKNRIGVQTYVGAVLWGLKHRVVTANLETGFAESLCQHAK